MSKKNYIRLYFMKVPPRTGYYRDRTELVPEDKAKEYIQDGYARKATEVLPADFPHRDHLIAGGLETVDAVKAEKDLKEIKGIGEKAEKEIADYLAG